MKPGSPPVDLGADEHLARHIKDAARHGSAIFQLVEISPLLH